MGLARGCSFWRKPYLGKQIRIMPTITLDVEREALPAVEELVSKHEGVRYAPLTPLQQATHLTDALIADGDFAPSERDRLISEYTETFQEVQDSMEGKKKLKSARQLLEELRQEDADELPS